MIKNINWKRWNNFIFVHNYNPYNDIRIEDFVRDLVNENKSNPEKAKKRCKTYKSDLKYCVNIVKFFKNFIMNDNHNNHNK